jgi:hypothetical protein
MSHLQAGIITVELGVLAGVAALRFLLGLRSRP